LLTHLWCHGRLPNIEHPATFNELVQNSKLGNRDPRLPVYADKLRVKPIVAAAIGADWVTPTLWHGTELPPRIEWPTPFVVKSRHGCNQNRFVHTGEENWGAIRSAGISWMRQSYGRWLDEWLYEDIPRGIIVEPFVGRGITVPIDYKFFVFGGRAEFIQVHLGRGIDHRWIVLDRAWRRVSSPTRDPDPDRPASLTAMVEAAETLAQNFEFVRVDLYEIGGRPRFGEMTFYPGSGLGRFDPPSLDGVMGAAWLSARRDYKANPCVQTQPVAVCDRFVQPSVS